VKFLVDNQLPGALARWLVGQGHDARHVLDLKLDESDDTVIWGHATQEGFVLVTKDEDFFHLSKRLGAPPQVVWVRIPNSRKRQLLDTFASVWPQVSEALMDGDALVEVR